MAAKWNLVCLTCLEALRLGRFVAIDDNGEPIEPYWEGFLNGWDRRRIEGSELSRVMDRFLADHVGHELGIIETGDILEALEGYELGSEPLKWVDDAEDLDERDLRGTHDMIKSDASAALRRRLRTAGSS